MSRPRASYERPTDDSRGDVESDVGFVRTCRGQFGYRRVGKGTDGSVRDGGGHL